MTSLQRPIANRYQLIRQLAAGSYGETWLANDLSLDRYVALKLQHQTDDNQEYQTEQFLREARIAASVSHQNVVAIFDAGSQNDRPFLVMEWVDGCTLKEEILGSRRVTPDRALTVTAEILDGLDGIHQRGIIHRDIKPQNIMVNELGTVKLTDFGIARLPGEADARDDGTTTGSAAYMAPEQAQALPITAAADVYAAGVILYEMLTGRLPFVSTDPQQVLEQHIAQPVPRPRRVDPEIPAQLEAVILKALEKDPRDRFQSAGEMRRAVLAARPHLAPRRPVIPPPRSEPVRKLLPRFAWIASSVTLMLVMIVGATTLAVRDSGNSSPVADDPSPTSTPAPAITETAEPTATITEAAVERQQPEPIDDDDFLVIRGEIVVEGVPESSASVNRPAPSREATDEDRETDDDDEPTTASDQTQQPAPQPTPTPAPVDSSQQDDNDEDDVNQDESESDSPGQDSDNQSDDPGNSGEAPGQSNGGDQSDGGNGNAGEDQNASPEGQSDDDAPAASQGQNDDENDNGSEPEGDPEPSAQTQASDHGDHPALDEAATQNHGAQAGQSNDASGDEPDDVHEVESERDTKNDQLGNDQRLAQSADPDSSG